MSNTSGRIAVRSMHEQIPSADIDTLCRLDGYLFQFSDVWRHSPKVLEETFPDTA